MESTLLQAPRPGGRSRFSKALPAPPPELNNVFISTSPLTLPSTPRPSAYDLSSPGPPPAIPPARKALPSMPAIVSPTNSVTPRAIDSPLPPLPLSKVAPAPAPVPAPAIPIKRRPVGGSLKSPDSTVSTTVTLPAAPPPDPSPTDSLSSLFSAYSRSSGESLVRTSQGTANTVISYSAWSPEKDMAGKETSQMNAGEDNVQKAGTSNFLSADTHSQSQPRTRSESPVLGIRPPPPMKDDPRPTTPVTVRSFAAAPSSSPPKQLPATPPQTQLWERRSNKASPPKQLNLNGSTTNVSSVTGNTYLKENRIEAAPISTTSLVEPKPPFASSQLPTPSGVSPFPRSAGLPGKSIRPIQQPQQQLPSDLDKPPPPPAKMGNEKSKIASMKEKWEQAAKGTTTPKQDTTAAPLSPIKRLPTPDYEPSDVQRPLVETIVSPASPATSPEMPALDQGARNVPIARRPVGSPPPTSNPMPPTSIGNISPLPSAGPGPARGRMNAFPVSPVNAPGAQEQARAVVGNPDVVSPMEAEPPVSRIPAPTTAPRPTYTVHTTPATPPRSLPTLSVDTSAAGASPLGIIPVASGPSVAPVNSSVVTAPSPQPQTASNPDNLSPIDGELSPSSAAAAFFPRMFTEIRPAGYVFPAKPLGPGHYNCFIGHKTLHANKNDLCPLRCQTCAVEDKYLRWTCSMCSLRVCRGCKEFLLKNDRDLSKLMEHIQIRKLSEDEIAEMAATDAQVDEQFKKAEERRRVQAEEREQAMRQRRMQQQQLLKPPRPRSSGSQGSASSVTSAYSPVPPAGAFGGGAPRPMTPTERAAPRP